MHVLLAVGSPIMQIPTFGFLYIAGYIGHTGRKYLHIAKKAAKPTEKEIIIVCLNLFLACCAAK